MPRLILAFLLLGVAALGSAQDFREVERKIRTLPPERVAEEVRKVPNIEDRYEFEGLLGRNNSRVTGEKLRALVQLAAMAEGGKVEPAGDPVGQAKAIKAGSAYQDAGVQDQSNWLGRALTRLRHIKLDFPEFGPRGDMPQWNIGDWFIKAVWFVLAGVALFFGYLAVKHIRWKMNLARKAKAILEEDEPERTLDEWLAQADLLAASGKHREAVRALYLACLLRFDEARVARFIRAQTNWEHLYRIEGSANLPGGVNFRVPTQAFDRIWYGQRTEGQADVDRFRSWYQEITGQLGAKA